MGSDIADAVLADVHETLDRYFIDAVVQTSFDMAVGITAMHMLLAENSGGYGSAEL